MDSFLEEPRTTPKPTPVIQSIETPTVPEVSLMFQNARKDKPSLVNFGKQMQSYNAWKLRNNNNSNNNDFDSFLLAGGNKENIQQTNSPDKSFLSKKQVRFQSPIHKSASTPTFPINKHIEHLLPSTNFKRTIENTPSKHLETYVLNNEPTNRTSPLRVDSNPLFQPTSMDALKRLETLGINNENCPTTPKSTQFMNSLKSINNSPANTFEKMYCSGIPTPNKELDLSFLEPQKNPCPRQEYFKRSISDSPSKKFLNYVDHYNSSTTQFEKPFIFTPTTPKKTESTTLQNNETIQIDNNKKETAITVTNNIINNNNTELVETVQDQTSENIKPNTDNNKKSAEEGPTVNDLLQIIKLQNDQLQRLQNQVEMLVKLSENSQKEKAQITVENVNKNIITYKDQQVGTSISEEILEKHDETTNVQKNVENNGKKISVGMMTSFEVSFKPPLAKKKSKAKLRNLTPVADFSNECSTNSAEALAYQKQQQKYEEEQRNQEFLKRNARNKQRDERNYPNQWQNNTNVRRNNETEYSLGSGQSLEIQEQPESPENSIHIDMQDYDTESEDSDDECSTDTGWTFYKDILGQVNNILENSNRPAYRPNKLPNKRNAIVPTETETTLEQIQQNTLRRLQNDGFLQKSEQCAIRPNEISFAVKQILMKYLPDDGLAEAVTKNKTDERYNTDKRKPTDISVTAVKYMQQCNVVTNAPQYYGRKQKPSTSKNKIIPPSSSDPKILDITTLKQQPKLL